MWLIDERMHMTYWLVYSDAVIMLGWMMIHV